MIDFINVHTDEQISEAARLAREIWQDHYIPIIGKEQVDYMLKEFQSEHAIAKQLADGYEYYILVYNGEGVGYLAVVPDTNNSKLLLSKIYVKKAARSNGLGKKMLAFVEGVCRLRQLSTIWLTVNKNNKYSIAWYLRMGFTNTGPIIQDIGGGFVMDDFRMEKSLG